MSRALLLIILASCGARAPVPGREGTTEPLCWWRNARWDDRATLLVRGTQVPLARARARWSDGAWKGASTTAVLRRSGDSVMLEGEWTGPGAALTAQVDVGNRAVFRAWEPRRLGAAGLVLKGGYLRVKDALLGRALVLPSEESLAPFQSEVPAAAELSCDVLSLSATPPVAGDAARALVARAGFSSEAPEQELPPNVSVPASAVQGGPTVGLFAAKSAPVRGFVVEQREGEARLVVPTPDGVVWVGWVTAEALQKPTSPLPEAPGEVLASAPQRDWRSCKDRELPLTIELQGRFLQVGSLQAGTPFSVGAREGDHREVALGLDWLELSPRLQVLVPASAINCPRAEW